MEFILILHEIYFTLRVPTFVYQKFTKSNSITRKLETKYCYDRLSFSFFSSIWNGNRHPAHSITYHPDRAKYFRMRCLGLVKYGQFVTKRLKNKSAWHRLFFFFFSKIQIINLYHFAPAFTNRNCLGAASQANYCPAAFFWNNRFPPKNIQNEEKMAG